MADVKKRTGFEARMHNARIRHPELSEAALRDLVQKSYLAKSPEGRERQRAGLTSGCDKAKRINKGNQPPKPKPRPNGFDDFQGMPITDFATQACGVQLYPAQAVVLKALYGEPLTEYEMSIYNRVAGGLSTQHEPGRPCVEGVLVVGARSGKSLLVSIMALYETVVMGHQWREHLRASEWGYALIIATKLGQAADIIAANAGRIALESESLKGLLACPPTATKIEFRNKLCIQALACTSNAGRGLPCYFLACDEIAHFYSEGPKADVTIYNSIAPRLAQFRGARTILASTPAAKQGLLWDWYSEGFQVPGRHTFQASTMTFNPDLDTDYLDRQARRDPDNFAREFSALFAERMESYFAADLVESALVLPGDVPAVEDVTYALAIDQSGLSGRDRFGAAVAHADEFGTVTVDATRSWDARDIDAVMAELAALARAYRIGTVLRDAYAAGWVSSSLSKVGLTSETRPGLPQVYSNLKSLLLGGNVRLPDSGELKAGLLNTQAVYGRNNSMSIAHQRDSHGHADLADGVAAACWAASGFSDPLAQVFSPDAVAGMAIPEEEILA